MFWRSVVGKLAVTILLLISLVLVILTVVLLSFFENYHLQEAEENMVQTASDIGDFIDREGHQPFIQEASEFIKDPVSGVTILYGNGGEWISSTSDENLTTIDRDWIEQEETLQQVLTEGRDIQLITTLPGTDTEAMIIGMPLSGDGAVFVYQSLQVINQTKSETTKIILLAAGIAILLTTFFAVFLSTRITSPLIKMKEAAHNLTRGEFDTKVPILTHDEIGDLAIEFNRMGRQLKFHINALHQEKEQLSSILSSMADGVVTLNRNGDMIVTNSPAEKFLGDWYFENNVDKDAHALPSELHSVLQEVIEGEKEVLHEMSVQGRNYGILMTPLYDEFYVRGAVAVIRDVTEERRLDKLRKDFIANISHELRTPISMMQGYSEAILDGMTASEEETRELTQIIHEESLRMNRLVSELLDIARIEAGHVDLNLEKVDVATYIERILKKFNNMANDNQIQLTLDENLVVSDAVLDPDRLEQVITNLIDNAIRHTSDHGRVNVSAACDDKELHIAITDSGSGIPEEDLPFVFERFYKADKSRTKNEKKKGTGLGLAIAKNIVEKHEGRINVQSKLNQGTTFSFRIPQKSDKNK